MMRSTVSAAIRACAAEVADPDRSMESTLFSDSGFMSSGSATSLVVQANSFRSGGAVDNDRNVVWFVTPQALARRLYEATVDLQAAGAAAQAPRDHGRRA